MRNRILFPVIPVIETLLATWMFFNWVRDSPWSFTLFVFGFVSGIAAASWISYINGQ